MGRMGTGFLASKQMRSLLAGSAPRPRREQALGDDLRKSTLPQLYYPDGKDQKMVFPPAGRLFDLQVRRTLACALDRRQEMT